MSDGLMPIGMFSRASLLSVRALRSYHQAGVLVPARVDPDTGYRAYDPGQLADAAVLRRLRQLDVPLAEVKRILVERDPEVTRKVLAHHEAVMRDRLDETLRVVAALQGGVAAPAEHTPAHVRDERHCHALMVRGRAREADFEQWLAAAYAEIDDVARRVRAEVAGSSGGLYPPTVPDDDENDLVAYVPITRPVPLPDEPGRVVLGEIPAGPVAVLVHVGPYDSIGDTYRTLGAWVARNAHPTDDWVREVYSVTVGDVSHPTDYRTEICWPLDPHLRRESP